MKKRAIGRRIITWLLVFTLCIIVFLSVQLGVRTYRDLQESYRTDIYAISIYPDTDKLHEYLDSRKTDEAYWDMQKNFLVGDENVKYYCVFVPGDNDIVCVWDMIDISDPSVHIEQDDASALGRRKPYMAGAKEALQRMRIDLSAQTCTVHDDEYGFVEATFNPILNESGEVEAVVALGVSVLGVWGSVATYVLTYVAGVLAITAVAAFVLYRRIDKNIVQPIEELNAASKRMVDSLETGEDVSLDIHTGDELEELSDSFVAMYGEIGAYVRENARITAERERIGTELSLASKIQADMLPSAFSAFSERKEFTVYASMTPAKEVGGDFYDFFLVDHDHLGVVIADVSGKGVPAALFMMMAKIMIEGNASMGVGPGEALQMVNNKICENNREDMFVTVWLGILELSTGRLVAANAGHDKPVLMRPGGDFEVYADRHGFVVGGMEDMVYREYELKLEPGSKLFLYTDGVPEANDADENLFGMERTLEALNKAKDGTAYDEIQSVQDAVGKFVGDAPQFDDLTMLCLQYNGVDEEANAKGGLAC